MDKNNPAIVIEHLILEEMLKLIQEGQTSNQKIPTRKKVIEK
jgi:hypothetical protein